jgi:hypothetical protein
MKGAKILFVLLFLIFSIKGFGVEKDTTRVGLFLTSLHDFDLTDQSYTAEFWLWFNYKNDSLKPLDTREISNAKSVESSIPDTEKKGLQRKSGPPLSINGNWNISLLIGKP